MSELYYAWNRKGQPITKVGDDFLRPIAQKLSQLNCHIFGKDTGMFEPDESWRCFANVVRRVEPKPIWMPRMRSVPVLPREDILQSLTHPVGHWDSPLLPGMWVEGKLDEMRCYMVVWSDHIKDSFGAKPGGYIGYDLGLFTDDRYPGFKGRAVIHDIVAKWSYVHRKEWLEQDNMLQFITLDGSAGGLFDYDPVFVNRRVMPSKFEITKDYQDDVRKAVQIATNPISPFSWYEGIVMKNQFHLYDIHYIEPHEVGKTQVRNIGEWEKLRWK